MEEKLNFEKLSKEVLQESKNDYMSKIDFTQTINTPMLKIIFDYFNVLNDRKKLQKEHGLYINGFIDGRNLYSDNLPESPLGNLNYKVEVSYKDEFSLFVVLSRFQVDGNWVSTINFTSNKQTYITSEYIYKKIIYAAVSNSNLKGSYFIMPPNELRWDSRELAKRGFEDIYLPNENLEDLKLFTGLFEKKGELMRYLLAGTPGTGKTEATLAMSNVLKKSGVTIIKTTVCDLLKEKMELAELLAPSLVIFDDIDLSLGSRNKGGVSRSLGTFLDALDGTDKLSDSVGIIATTNSLELLDTAAQRPGRFDKLMSFEYLTKDNIKNIILKSLRKFELSDAHPVSKVFTEQNILDFYHDNRLTGSHIFSYTKMIMRKIDVLDKKDFHSKWIIKEIEHILKSVEVIVKGGSSYLNSDKLKGESSPKKFGISLSDDTDEIDDSYYDEPSSDFITEERDYRDMSSDENYREE